MNNTLIEIKKNKVGIDYAPPPPPGAFPSLKQQFPYYLFLDGKLFIFHMY